MTRFYIQYGQIQYKSPALRINEMINTGGTVSNSSLTVSTLKYKCLISIYSKLSLFTFLFAFRTAHAQAHTHTYIYKYIYRVSINFILPFAHLLQYGQKIVISHRITLEMTKTIGQSPYLKIRRIRFGKPSYSICLFIEELVDLTRLRQCGDELFGQ